MKNTKTKLTVLVISICLLVGISIFVYKTYLPNQPLECDEIIEIPQSEPPEDFETMLKGIKYAVIEKEDINNKEYYPAFNVLEEYLIEMGFEKVLFDKNYIPQKISEGVYVYLSFTYNRYEFFNIGMQFLSTAFDYRQNFSTNKIARRDNNSKENFKYALRDMYGDKKPDFDSTYTIQLAKKQTCWTEEKLKNIMQKKGCDEIEGIYENYTRTKNMQKYRVAVRNMNGTYYLIYLSGAGNSGDWAEGEIKATLEPTATSMLYKAYWIMADKTENDNYYIEFKNKGFNLNSNDKDTTFYIKMFPPAKNKKH